MKEFLKKLLFKFPGVSIKFLLLFLLIQTGLFSPNSYAEPQIAKIRIAIPNFTVLDKALEKKNITPDLLNSLKIFLNSNNAYKLVETKEQFNSSDLLTSGQIITLGSKNGIDIILTGSLTKFNNDILVNIRLSETVIGRVLFSKEYFVKQNEFSKIKNNIFQDLNYFANNFQNMDLRVIDIGGGTSEIKVNSIPNNAIVAFDNNEVGTTPIILKNISNTQHLIEAWQEEQASIKSFNISAEDEKIFQLSFNNKTYTETTIRLSDLENSEYSFEIIANPKDRSESKERPKFSDIKYDIRKFRIDIITEPSNIQVVIDGKTLGASPVTINDISQGKHKLKLNKKKLLIFKQVVDSYKNKISEVNFNLYKLGRVLISSFPTNADIYIDTQKIGITPKSIDLPLGKHTLDIKREGFKPETYSLDVIEGKTNEMSINLTSLRNVDTNVSFLPTAVVDDTLGISAFFMSLGQYNLDDKTKKLAYLYGSEINYGFKNLYSFGKYINLGVQVGAFYNKLDTFSFLKNFHSDQGIAAKLQFLSQGELIPVSAAIGTFYNFNSQAKHQFNGYISATRDFGFISVHLGLQMQPYKLSALNLNINYNRFYRLKLGAAVLIDFGLLTNDTKEYITPLFGLTAGYNFF